MESASIQMSLPANAYRNATRQANSPALFAPAPATLKWRLKSGVSGRRKVVSSCAAAAGVATTAKSASCAGTQQFPPVRMEIWRGRDSHGRNVVSGAARDGAACNEAATAER